MTIPSPFSRRGLPAPTLPRGDILGSYDTYAEAQAVLARLSKAEFPVKQLAIVGSDLRTVERITGKLTNLRVALAGAIRGAWFGLFLGLIVFLTTASSETPVYVGAAVLIGAAFGMIIGVVTFSISRQKRDYTSMSQLMATRYEILVDPSLTIRAQELLARPVA